MPDCPHERLCLRATDFAESFPVLGEWIQYRPPGEEAIRDALLADEPVRKKPKTSSKSKFASKTSAPDVQLPPPSTFPAPVVLRGDELQNDPEYPPQRVQEWIDEEERNEVTKKRRTIYVVPPPASSEDVQFVDDWTAPSPPHTGHPMVPARPLGNNHGQEPSQKPLIEDVAEYLQAFYYGLPVKILSKPKLEFTRWDSDKKVQARRGSRKMLDIGLSTEKEAVRIRCRLARDRKFPAQLNLNDLIDVGISILPSDAYALIMLMHHDLYESANDDFCCGRAYGGSRVAVISTARYRPVPGHDEHSWPASHCLSYMKSTFPGPALAITKQPKPNPKALAKRYPASAIAAAVVAWMKLPSPTSPAQLYARWLGSVCKTVSHEIGHCFGIDHCVYYACIMQGSANMREDSHQPPYLCPIDLSKILRATGAGEKQRYKALLEFCGKWKQDRMFAAFAAWIETRLSQANAVTTQMPRLP